MRLSRGEERGSWGVVGWGVGWDGGGGAVASGISTSGWSSGCGLLVSGSGSGSCLGVWRAFFFSCSCFSLAAARFAAAADRLLPPPAGAAVGAGEALFGVVAIGVDGFACAAFMAAAAAGLLSANAS